MATRIRKDKSWETQQFDKYSQICRTVNKIPQELYKQYEVKRGLRNTDGSGVLVGLTEIGGVRGYVMDDNVKRSAEGLLHYRGIDIGELVRGFQSDGRHGFEETCYLLLFGNLPNAQELKDFQYLLDEFRALPDGFTDDMILQAPSKDIMNKLARATLANYSYDPSPEPTPLWNLVRQCIQLIARFPAMIAYGYQAKAHYHDRKSLFIHNPEPEIGTAANILRMTRPDAKYTELEAEVLDLCLVLHAEHGGGNNSTFTVHVVTSAATDLYSAISAGVGSLKGLKHGGANVKVVRMMQNIKDRVQDCHNEKQVGDHLRKIMRREAFDREGLIYGMGHAVYTLSDPRCGILKEKARVLAEEHGFEDDFIFYEIVERLAPEIVAEVKKTSKSICPNVDFFSGFVYQMLNIPIELYTPLFAAARVAGWCSHAIEETIAGGRIMRPAFKNVAEPQEYLPLAQRNAVKDAAS